MLKLKTNEVVIAVKVQSDSGVTYDTFVGKADDLDKDIASICNLYNRFGCQLDFSVLCGDKLLKF